MSEICADCRSPYQLTETEKRSFETLISQRPGFKMPRRCSRCRKVRRDQQNARGPMAVPSIPMKSASTLDTKVVIVSAGRPDDAPVTVKPTSVDMVLGTGDFEDLVSGKAIVWRGVRIVLADIGFKVMYDAIERAEVARISAAHKRPAVKS